MRRNLSRSILKEVRSEMAPAKKNTENETAEVVEPVEPMEPAVDYTIDDTDPVPEPAPESAEPKTGTPTPEAIRAERERVENVEHPQLPDAVNSEGEVISYDDQPPADVQIDDVRAMIPPPATSSYVTFPDEVRDDTENDRAEDHREDVLNEAGEKIGEKGHWVQVVQVRTFDDGRVPQVSFRCECNREYVVDWTGDLTEKIVRVSRT
jgi:hypothetical protein